MKHVVIIGGGFAGSIIAQRLEKDFRVTLIDTKEYFEFTPGILRSLVEPLHVRKIQVLHTHYLKRAEVVHGQVTAVKESAVVLHSGEEVTFDYLAICTGSQYQSPIKEGELAVAERGHELREYHQRMQDAAKILIVGGGLVGVELAAEIATKHDKAITLVQAKPRLMERQPKKAAVYADRFLRKRGVTIKYNTAVTEKKDDQYILDSGEGIATDLAFMCTGIKPQAGLVKKHFGEMVTEQGFIEVNEYLQMQDHIFVAGDAAAVGEEKTAQNAEEQGKVVAENILRLEQGKDLCTYSNKERIMVISLGKWNGLLTYKGYTLKGLIPGLLKTAIEKREMWRKW